MRIIMAAVYSITDVFHDYLEKITLLVELIEKKQTGSRILLFFALLAPAAFLNTVYDCWFGSDEFIMEIKTQSYVFLITMLSEFVALLATLPSRHEGKIIRWVMLFWFTEMLLIWLATVVR